MRHRVACWTFAAAIALAMAGFVSDVARAAQGCVTGYDPSPVSVPGSGGMVTFNVLTSSPTCHWEASGSTPPPVWLLPLANQSGDGPRTIQFFAPSNPNPTPRSGVVTYDGRPLTFNQAGGPCQFTFSTPAPQSVNGGIGTFTVNPIGSSCTYTAQSASSSLTIVSGASGSTFPATVTFSLTANLTQDAVTHLVQISNDGTFTPFTSGISIVQNGPPISTDLSATLIFAVLRKASGPPYVSPPEPVRIVNAEDPSASWSASTGQPWLNVSPSSGAGPATITISVDAAALSGTMTGGSGTIDIAASNGPVPKRLNVGLRIFDETTEITQPPGGKLDIPTDNSFGLSGAIPMGGWAIDDVGIARVQLYRNAVAGEGAGPIYLGDATRVRGARPDVVAYSSSPGVRSAGWGFMILSNVLPNGGNGTFTLYAVAEDVEAHRTLIGQTVVTFDNTNSIRPFGTIDIPMQGGTVSSTMAVHGWVLAQPNQGRFIPFDGTTIRLHLDGVQTALPASYNHLRPDVRALFPPPAYANGDGAGGFFLLDTTTLADGLHTMAWVVTDNLGTIEGIGSRYFNVANGGSSPVVWAPSVTVARSARELATLARASSEMSVRMQFDDPFWSSPVDVVGEAREIQHARGERLEVTLDTWEWLFGCGSYSAYFVTGDAAGPLPPGASFETNRGIFRWMPPPEFAGTFDFVFVRRECGGQETRMPLKIVIAPARM